MSFEDVIVDWATRESAYPDCDTWKEYLCGFESAGPSNGQTHGNLTLEEFINSIKMYADNLADSALGNKVELVEKYGRDGYRSIRKLTKCFEKYDHAKLAQAATDYWNEANEEV